MSRIGKMPIAIPAGVTVEVAENNKVTVKGPKGELSRVLPKEMKISVNDGVITIERPNDLKKEKSLQHAMIAIKHKFGKNAILKGANLQEGAMTMERNQQLGGHKA